MFEKKQIIFSETIGVCRVDDITRIAMRTSESPDYYVLRSVFNKDKVSYIPVENHQVQLRELRTKEEIEKLMGETPLDKWNELLKAEAEYILSKDKK
ncbi:MAG: CarD family transcriptional regulator [Lachnospiraceae bacterium]|nr:CarD family transcriptional regulator [Lachnospiraceae bacterium]